MILGVWRQEKQGLGERPPYLHSPADEVIVVPHAGEIAWWQGPTLCDQYGEIVRYAGYWVGISSRQFGSNMTALGLHGDLPAGWVFV